MMFAFRFLFDFLDHSNGYIEFNDEPFDSSRLRGRPYVTKLGKESTLTLHYFEGLRTLK